jgi:hypothetical protein
VSNEVRGAGELETRLGSEPKIEDGVLADFLPYKAWGRSFVPPGVEVKNDGPDTGGLE